MSRWREPPDLVQNGIRPGGCGGSRAISGAPSGARSIVRRTGVCASRLQQQGAHFGVQIVGEGFAVAGAV